MREDSTYRMWQRVVAISKPANSLPRNVLLSANIAGPE